VTTIERRAADARRAAAERAAEQDGNDQAAFMRQRSMVAGLSRARRVPTATELRAQKEQAPSGKLMFHTTGYFTRYGRGYEMWDDYGKYVEMTMRGSGAATLAAAPDVCFLVNHLGVAMARTKTGTLKLSEDDTGGWHEAWLNPDRPDVVTLAEAIKDGDVDEMSFAFMIPEGQGIWSDDFTTFQIRQWDIERGDVSAVNHGANPYTDVAGQAAEVLRELDHLPRAARAEAAARLGVVDVERQMAARERVVVKVAAVDRTASDHVRMLQWRRANTARRYAALAEETGLSAADLASAALPWYQIRAASEGAPDATLDEADALDATDILIYDEIGGSFGVSADQFADDLAAIDTPRINLRINSPGGSVVDAIAIASSIRHKRDTGTKITSYADGIVASAATFIAIAADEVVAMPGSEWMFHYASSTIDGNKLAATQMATFLDFQDRNIADMYALKSGVAADWLEMMAAETWMTASEAQDAGIVDRVWNSATKQRGERAATDPRLTRKWDDLPYRYTSRAAAPVTQMRRSLTSLGGRTDEFSDMVKANASGDLGTPVGSGSTPVKPSGRSISRIAAEMAALGVTDLDA
jgi:HK97 family phage prohead protease